MDVEQLAPGLWRWDGSVYVETAEAIVLIDPVVPADEPERFWRALDRDVERCGVPVHVLLTSSRSSAGGISSNPHTDRPRPSKRSASATASASSGP